MGETHVLFVDDEVLSQWTLSETLTQAGFKVTSVCRAADAVRLLRSSASFGVLLTDIALPDDLSGVELAEHWRHVNPGRPVIYVTHLPPEIIGELEEDETLVQKPCRGRDVLLAVMLALNKGLRWDAETRDHSVLVH